MWAPQILGRHHRILRHQKHINCDNNKRPKSHSIKQMNRRHTRFNSPVYFVCRFAPRTHNNSENVIRTETKEGARHQHRHRHSRHHQMAPWEQWLKYKLASFVFTCKIKNGNKILLGAPNPEIDLFKEVNLCTDLYNMYCKSHRFSFSFVFYLFFFFYSPFFSFSLSLSGVGRFVLVVHCVLS